MLAAGLILLGVVPLPEADHDLVAQTTSTRNKRLPLQIKDFRYAGQEQNRLVRVLEARELVVQPRRFGVFNIKSVNEAVLKDAHFEVHFYEEAVEEIPLFDYQQVQRPSESTGRRPHEAVTGVVTRAIAKGVLYRIFRDESEKIVLHAEYGVMEKRKSGPEFFNATIKDSGSDSFIRSRKILWDEQERVFVIPGAYAMSASGRRTSGKAVQVDLDFRITQSAS
jgi:hypothetical protein